MDLMRNSAVSEHSHHGRHLRSTITSGVFSDVRISDVVITTRESSASTQGLNSDEAGRKRVLLGTNSSATRLSPHLNLFNSDMTGDSIDRVKDELGKQVDGVKDEMKHEMSKVKNEVSSVKDELKNEVSSVKDEMKNEMMNMKHHVSIIVKDEVRKKNKPLEEKLDHISRLLERVLVAM
jgi:gas vesicle protein